MRFGRYGGYCDNDREHEREAERDARYGHRDYEMYDRYTSDPCKEVYTEAYDRERDRMEHAREEREAEERREASQARSRREEAEYEEYMDYQRQEQHEQFPDEPMPEESVIP